MTRGSFVDELRNRRDEYKASLRKLAADQINIDSQVKRISEMLDHVEALLRAEEPAEFEPKASESMFTKGDLAGKSVNEALQIVLREAQRPMHADELLEALKSRGIPLSAKDPKATVVTALVRGAQKGKYRRTGPNTFALMPTYAERFDAVGLRHAGEAKLDTQIVVR